MDVKTVDKYIEDIFHSRTDALIVAADWFKYEKQDKINKLEAELAKLKSIL